MRSPVYPCLLDKTLFWSKRLRAVGIIMMITVGCFTATANRSSDKSGVTSGQRKEKISDLPELLVEGTHHKVLHILGYVREYTTMSGYRDTIKMFREKMVDFMIPGPDKSRFRGWTRPRVLNSRSYYQFRNSSGLDSVSDRCSHHFAWSDWIGILPLISLPGKLTSSVTGTETRMGKYSPAECWVRNGDKVTVDVNVLADTTARKWVPGLAPFFHSDNNEFDNFKLRFDYSNVTGKKLNPEDIISYSFDIESRGRGRDMFRFIRFDEPFYVDTHTEVYVLDREYITLKEAKKWDKRKFDSEDIGIFEASWAPELPAATLALIDRVSSINSDQVRISLTPDQRLKARHIHKENFSLGNRILTLLKQLTGITMFKSRRNLKRQWNEFRKDRIHKNLERYSEDEYPTN